VIKVYGSGSMQVKDRETDGFAFVKKSCMHCVDPSCVSACPVSAMHKDAVTGIVSYDKDACIGCRYCVAACPFRVPRFTYDRAFPQISKCQLCRHRIAEGKYSACAEVCPTGATLFGKVGDLRKEAQRRLRLAPGTPTVYPRGRIDGPDQSYVGVSKRYVNRMYGTTEFGGTQLTFLAAVPFERLGYPDLPPASDAANTETLQHTLYAGLVVPAAFLGVLSWAARRSAAVQEEETQGGQQQKEKSDE
jgi:Fe-S-cluster-containing dehydrogenase component